MVQFGKICHLLIFLGALVLSSSQKNIQLKLEDYRVHLDPVMFRRIPHCSSFCKSVNFRNRPINAIFR